jgi:hypothetical protein
MSMPPAGTSEKWEYTFKLLVTVLALAFACWSLVTARSAPGDLLAPGLALVTSGILVWDALTWNKNWPFTIYLGLYFLYKLGTLALQLYSAQPLRTLDYGIPLALAFLLIMGILNGRRERSAP